MQALRVLCEHGRSSCASPQAQETRPKPRGRSAVATEPRCRRAGGVDVTQTALRLERNQDDKTDGVEPGPARRSRRSFVSAASAPCCKQESVHALRRSRPRRRARRPRCVRRRCVQARPLPRKPCVRLRHSPRFMPRARASRCSDRIDLPLRWRPWSGPGRRQAARIIVLVSFDVRNVG